MSRDRKIEGRAFRLEESVGSRRSAEDVLLEIAKDEVFYQESGGGVTFSGGEPLMQADFVAQALKFCKERELHTALDTCGCAEPAALEKVIRNTDLFLYDLKVMDDALHVEYTGVSNALSLTNLERITRAGKDVIIRFPVIPGFTDTSGNLEAVAGRMIQLGLKRIDLLPYHSIARHKYRKMGKEYFLPDIMEPSKERVEELREFFMGKGINASIGG